MISHASLRLVSVLRKSLIVTASLVLSSQIQAQSVSSPEELVRKGLSAGAKYPGLSSICEIDRPLKMSGSRGQSADNRPTLTDEERMQRAQRSMIAPQQVFDNLYFVGNRSVASWVIQTSEGLILIDAMNSNNQSEAIIAEGIRSLGMDPHDIRYLIITHAHGDHYGGQEFLVKNFQPRVVMSDRDWSELESPEPEISNPKWGVPPTRDVSINDGDVIELGNTKVELYVTPGHTLGTVSLMFEVRDSGNPHMAALWGGTGLNFGPNIERLKMYSDSAARFQRLSREKSVDVFLSNHPTRDNSVERLKQLTERSTDTPHPFVDRDAVGAFELLSNCSLAQLIKIEQYQKRVQKHLQN